MTARAITVSISAMSARRACLICIEGQLVRSNRVCSSKSLSSKRLTLFVCQFPHAPREGTVPLSQSRHADEATLATNWETERWIARVKDMVSER
jgi:hypothetical protein